MLKQFCDFCSPVKEVNDPFFFCELQITRKRDLIIPTGKELASQPRMEQRVFHMCFECAGKKIKEVL